MSITTYSELQTAVASWLHRDNLTSQIPDFIRLGETRINRDLRIRDMVNAQSFTTSAGTATVALVSNYAEMISVYIEGSPRRKLTYVTPDNFYGNGQSDLQGKPDAYTIIGSNMHLSRIPDTAYSGVYTYYKKFTNLSSTNTTNYLTQSAPDLILYAACMEGSIYLEDQAGMQKFGELYQAAKAAIEKDDRRAKYGTSLSIRQNVGVI